MSDAMEIELTEAEAHARRWVYLRRDHALHERLLLEAPPEALAAVVERITPDIPAHWKDVPQRSGVLLMSLHYGPYANLLPLWLSREAARDRIGRLTVALHSGARTDLGLPESRLAALASVGFGSESALSLLNLRDQHPAETLFQRLREGEAILVFPDWTAHVAEGERPDGPVVRMGHTRLTLSRHAFWLAALAACPVVPVAIHQRADTHAISIGAPVRFEDRCLSQVIPLAERVLSDLWTATVVKDPAPWAGWHALATAIALRLEVEQRYGVALESEELLEVATAADLIALVNGRIDASGS